MLDDLRSSATYQDDEESLPEISTRRRARRAASGAGQFMGLTPSQRFIIALMLFMMVCVFGAFLLLITGRVVLPL